MDDMCSWIHGVIQNLWYDYCVCCLEINDGFNLYYVHFIQHLNCWNKSTLLLNHLIFEFLLGKSLTKQFCFCWQNYSVCIETEFSWISNISQKNPSLLTAKTNIKKISQHMSSDSIPGEFSFFIWLSRPLTPQTCFQHDHHLDQSCEPSLVLICHLFGFTKSSQNVIKKMTQQILFVYFWIDWQAYY